MISVSEVGKEMGNLYDDSKYLQKHMYHFCLVTYGKCVYWVNNEKLIMEKGDCLLIPGGNTYSVKSIPTLLHEKYKVEFRYCNEDHTLPILNGETHISTKLGNYDLILEQLISLKDSWIEELPYYQLMSNVMFVKILIILNRELDRGVVSSGKHRIVEVMKNYMQRNHRGRVTKEHVGEVIRKSPNYAASLFSQVTGQTISGYVHGLRVKTAIYMLTESQLSISEISEYVGYEDVSYFNRVFKRITGKVPSDYRN